MPRARGRIAAVLAATLLISGGAVPAGAAPWSGTPGEAAEPPASTREPRQPRFVVRYDVRATEDLRAQLRQFRRVVDDTLADPDGWSADGIVAFVDNGTEPDLTVWLASPGTVAAADAVCSPHYSCRVGDDVYVNAARWRRGADSYRQRGLRDYRRYVINHEVGHWLGLGHRSCREGGTPAPIMKQQTIGLGDCLARTRPLAGERRRMLPALAEERPHLAAPGRGRR